MPTFMALIDQFMDTCLHCGEPIEPGVVNDRAVWVDDIGAMFCNDDDSGEQHYPVAVVVTDYAATLATAVGERQ